MSRFLHFSSRAISFFHRRALRSSALELRWIKGLITVGIIYMSIYMSIYIYIYLDKYLGLYSIYQGVDNVIPIICGFPGNVP